MQLILWNHTFGVLYIQHHYAILNAINLGGNTDTIATLTGVLAEIMYSGYNHTWWNKVKRKNKVEIMIRRFQNSQ